MVVGEAGIGKSHFVKELSARLAFDNRKFVYINIEDAVSVEDLTIAFQKALHLESKELLGIEEASEYNLGSRRTNLEINIASSKWTRQ